MREFRLPSAALRFARPRRPRLPHPERPLSAAWLYERPPGAGAALVTWADIQKRREQEKCS
ncbi:MAG: hypothetical protein DBY09_06795 [Selenomonadales bacterium]|nr:MAG: hypothetical protein DBY09_06795 [Selenomonadales bacterium]